MIDWEDKFAQGFAWDAWLDNVTALESRWRDRYDNAWPDEELLDACFVEEPRYVLCVVADDCTDSAGTIPYIARALEDAGDEIELRILRKAEHPDAMEQLLVDGKRATPAVVIFDEDWALLARWGPRPAAARDVFTKTRARLSEDDTEEVMDEWYSQDEGDATLAEFLPLLRRPRRRETRFSLPVYFEE